MTLERQFKSLKQYGYVVDNKRYEEVKVEMKNGTTYTRRQLVGSDKDEKSFDIKATKKQIDELPSMDVPKGAEQLSNSELKSIYKALPDGENETDGRKVAFVNSSFGKIIGHGNEMIKTIIPYLKKIYDKSIPLHDSNYVSQNKRADGSAHKEHDNFKGYHNYLGEIKADGEEYYVRFTLQETKSAKEERNQFHDVFVSDIELYKNKTAGSRNLPDNNRATDEPRGLDKILNEVLEKVNENPTHDTSEVKSLLAIFRQLKGA